MSNPKHARVTLVQFAESGPEPAENLAAMQSCVEDHCDTDLLVFPELTLAGHEVTQQPPSALAKVLKAVTKEDVRAFERFIRDKGVQVVYGEVREHHGRLYNAATFTNGRTRTSYYKTHVHWSEAFEGGTEFPVFDSPLGPTGMLICFDAAFPEVGRMLAVGGAKTIINLSAIPSHFPLKHVHRRLAACSVSNQLYTIFVNRTGPGFGGGSAVVDPLGEFVAIAGEDEHAITVDLDLDLVDEWRAEEPLLQNRRPLIYKGLTEV